MGQPLISICLPNLNTFPYLRERIDTILAQTHTNWELIVIDGHSDDGSWEFFEELARKDSRVSIAQAPRGMYESWNLSVTRARGAFVYIATSDDGMAPDCLERLAGALQAHPECDVAHCTLVVVNQEGAPVPTHRAMADGLFRRSAPELADRMHVRKAPYDGLLCLLREHVYYSITETLVRRSLFSKIGGFETRWGSMSDFHWHMRVGLTANIVHVPETWATWRIHPGQATASMTSNAADYDAKLEDMIGDAVQRFVPFLVPEVADGLHAHWLQRTRELTSYYHDLRLLQTAGSRRLYQLLRLFGTAAIPRAEIFRRLRGEPKWPEIAPCEIQHWLDSLGVGPVLMEG